MIAALYSSRCDGGTKDFMRDGTCFGWSTIQAVYRADLCRAKGGISRRVPGLKFSHVDLVPLQMYMCICIIHYAHLYVSASMNGVFVCVF